MHREVGNNIATLSGEKCCILSFTYLIIRFRGVVFTRVGVIESSRNHLRTARSRQERPRAAKSSQEQPGAAKSSAGQPGAARSSEKQPGAARSTRKQLNEYSNLVGSLNFFTQRLPRGGVKTCSAVVSKHPPGGVSKHPGGGVSKHIVGGVSKQVA